MGVSCGCFSGMTKTMGILSNGPEDAAILAADAQPAAISLDDDVPVLSRKSYPGHIYASSLNLDHPRIKIKSRNAGFI